MPRGIPKKRPKKPLSEYEIVIGIDPGLTGAIAAIKGDVLLMLESCPLKGRSSGRDYDYEGMAAMLGTFKDEPAIVYIEHVHAFPHQGLSSTFKFGKGYGAWLGIIGALKLPIVIVDPRKWKNNLLADTDKSKRDSCLLAKRLFPKANMKRMTGVIDDHNKAEATLIAVYGGKQEWQR